ncbi:MAG TPA: Gfo/Idh/MocA family oxidoreductase [Roseiflexaceae bacterium]|nr:Gfo/Idh/MocA family oxidoreductase [Roseiflexaceae bacterium]
MAPEIGIGLIGYGAIGRLHALCYRMLPLTYPDLPLTPRLLAVATASPASAERARRELGDLFVTTNFEQLIGAPGVALVDCCAPTGDHARMATATLLAGRALFCEKPLTANPADSQRIVALAQERGLNGGINFHFRFIPALQEARRLIENGLLGDVLGFHMRYYRSSNLRRDRPATWRFSGAGSGVLVDLGSHLIDMTLHLLGPIAAVAARTRTLIEQRPGADGRPVHIESDDAAWLQLELDGGGRGTIEVSKLVPGAADDVRIEAYGTNGALTFDTRDPNSLNVAEGAGAAPGGHTIMTFSRIAPPAALPSPETPTATLQWHLASLAAFVQALAAGARAQPDLQAGLAVDRVLAAAAQSAARGGEQVQISTISR